ncbi:hypothetical protein K437DRAFT_48391 [Tilletiaria anomala UBC 951]|uniref:Uncharacterized protein n=1 Tax=Tilletiaria anomala (strain ATCC 24038 / CBS 436.72 / UBC 951) TaxID=1037660 RepID=A0A066V921_TILAU|nr:uncharacterized protein K437DRAFT_48391 [Tilletiaria anomala UBC 951]KDN36778.1 hypothetical protein K437DRAFT_48391 [Tilletiaria anomala UBC 951]
MQRVASAASSMGPPTASASPRTQSASNALSPIASTPNAKPAAPDKPKAQKGTRARKNSKAANKTPSQAPAVLPSQPPGSSMMASAAVAASTPASIAPNAVLQNHQGDAASSAATHTQNQNGAPSAQDPLKRQAQGSAVLDSSQQQQQLAHAPFSGVGAGGALGMETHDDNQDFSDMFNFNFDFDGGDFGGNIFGSSGPGGTGQ